MNSRQRRGLALLLVSVVGAIVVFVGVASYVSQVNAEVGPTSKVFVARDDIPAYAAVLPENVEQVEMPTKYVTDTMIVREQDFLGYKAVNQIRHGSWLQSDMLVPASSIEDGQREISINFVADDGINGRVQPGDRVDVVAAFAAAKDDQVADVSVRRAQIPYNLAGIIVRDAKVVSVGNRTPVGVDVGDAQEGGAIGPREVVAVTFAVSVAEATRLAYAESFSVNLRLMRAGNNETGDNVGPGDISFGDLQLPGVLLPGAPKAATLPKDTGTTASGGKKP
jgi:pilus assembly protein CpaB